MRCYRRLLNILYKDHVPDEDVCRKIQAATGKYLRQETEIKEVWTCLKVFWHSKDNSAGHSARKKEEKVDKRRGGKIILRSGHGWTLLAQKRQLKTGLGGKGLL